MTSVGATKDASDYLSAVDQNDKPNLNAILKIFEKLNFINDWQVIPHATRYEIVGWITNTKDVIFGIEDLDLLQQVSRLRCTNITVQIPKNQGKPSIRIFYIPEREPVSLDEINLAVTIKKRKTWWR
jgi:L-rhamnose isomerase